MHNKEGGHTIPPGALYGPGYCHPPGQDPDMSLGTHPRDIAVCICLAGAESCCQTKSNTMFLTAGAIKLVPLAGRRVFIYFPDREHVGRERDLGRKRFETIALASREVHL